MSERKQTPSECGFRMPPEWSVQKAVWLSWPHNPDTWPDRMEKVQQSYAAFAAAISRYEEVRILRGGKSEQEIRDILSRADAIQERIFIFDIPTNDAWCRDHGPVFLKNQHTGETAIVDFQYNSWGGKFPPWDLDNAVPSLIAKQLSLKRFEIPIVCEGGALEINGLGDLITTESVLLNSNRNPGVSKQQMTDILCDSLGASQVIWLESGMAGDDTDGHVDTMARFFRDDAILLAEDPSATGRNREILTRNRKRLETARNSKGELMEILALPCPKPILPANWREEVLPATYANYLLVNGAVLVPTYQDDRSDQAAVKIIQQCFPEREIVPLDCYDIILEGGALHCLSQQQPN